MKHQAEQEEEHKLQLKAPRPQKTLFNLLRSRRVVGFLGHRVSFRMGTEAKVREAMPTLVRIFQTLDKDNSGNVTQEEPLGWIHAPVRSQNS